MDFTPPSEADVDMAIQDDALLDINLGAQYPNDPQQPHPANMMGNGLSDAFAAGMIPGVSPQQQPSTQPPLHTGAPSFSSVEEYAAFMGVKLEAGQEEMGANGGMPTMQQPGMNFATTPDPARIQANAAYFENLYRDQMMRGDMAGNATSMTLPAGIGSGVNSFMNPNGAAPPAPQAGPVYDRTTELAFSQMNARPYDPTTGFTPAAGPMGMQKPAMHHMLQQPVHDMGAQTLSPEVLSAMIKTNNPAIHNFEHLSEDERAALVKEEKSRERNRDHSRKSRLRKKEYVEGLKQDVQRLQMYQTICEQSQDLMAIVTPDAKALMLYASTAFSRVLGYQLTSQSSFLEMVHPDNVAEVRGIFQKLTNPGDTRRFRFRIKSADGEFFDAETTARVTEKGIVCSTRVDRDM